LQPGADWKKGFLGGLINSKTFVCLLSRGAINSPFPSKRQNFSQLHMDSPCDNLLLEIRLAVELQEIGFLEKIFPVFVGDLDMEKNSYGNYFHENCHPTACPDFSIPSLEKNLLECMENEGLGSPIYPERSIHSLMTAITTFQGAFIQGERRTAFDSAVSQIVKMFSDAEEHKVFTEKESLHEQIVVIQENEFLRREVATLRNVRLSQIVVPRNAEFVTMSSRKRQQQQQGPTPVVVNNNSNIHNNN
jgi:hypothetical protein